MQIFCHYFQLNDFKEWHGLNVTEVHALFWLYIVQDVTKEFLARKRPYIYNRTDLLMKTDAKKGAALVMCQQ